MDQWSKENYTCHNRETSTEMERLPETNPVSGRVTEQRLRAAPILKGRRQQNREEIRKKGSLPRVSTMGANYRRTGAARGPPGAQVPPGRGPTPGSATRAPVALVGPLQLPLDYSRILWCADFLYNFLRIYWA